MKYLSCLTTGILLLALFSCKKDATQATNNYIGVNKCQAFTVAGKTLRLCLDSVIEDSRCPSNAVCTWEGVAVARFSAGDANQSQFITLATAPLEGYNKETVIDGYKIEFINLSPYTLSTPLSTYNDYVAEVKVTRF